MSKRRVFIPDAPTCSILESRLAPSGGGFLGLGTFFDKLGNDLGITHHSSANAASGIQQLWNESTKLSKPHHTVAHPLAKLK